MARALALATALAVSLLATSGAGGADAQTPKRGGTVVIATPAPAEPPCLNPFVDTCGVPSPLDLGLLEVLAGAFELSPDGTHQPNLISRARFVSRRPVTLEYHIRPEARWSDGVPVTASDFVFTHQTILKQRPGVEGGYPATVRSVHELDTKSFRVVLRFPFADWRVLFGLVLPRHALAGEDLASVWEGAIDNPKTGQLIGSGPFLARLERGRQLTLVRNPRYWGAHTARLDRLVFRFVPLGDAGAMRRGDVDMINPTSSTLQAHALELLRRPEPGIRVLPVLRSAWDHVAIRTIGGHPALSDPLVRRALAYGVDRVAIARTIGRQFLEGDTALQPLDSVVFLANSSYYEPNWRSYRYRPDQSRRLLEQAGCRRGSDGIYSCHGDRLSLRFVTPTGTERRARTLELAQEQLLQVGVEVRLVFVLPTVFNESVLERGDYDLALFNFVTFASTAGPTDIFGCQRPLNYMGYCDRLVTRDLDQATRILDDSRRVGLLNRVDVRLAKAVPAIPLFQDKRLFALKANIRGVVPNGSGFFTWNAENWWLADRP